MWCAVCYGCGAWQEIFILMRILPAKGEVRREMRNTEKYWLPGWCRWMRQGSCRDNTNYVLLTRETLDAMSIQYQYTSGREGDDSVSKVMICCCYWFVQTAPKLNTDLHTLLAGCDELSAGCQKGLTDNSNRANYKTVFPIVSGHSILDSWSCSCGVQVPAALSLADTTNSSRWLDNVTKIETNRIQVEYKKTRKRL